LDSPFQGSVRTISSSFDLLPVFSFLLKDGCLRLLSLREQNICVSVEPGDPFLYYSCRFINMAQLSITLEVILIFSSASLLLTIFEKLLLVWPNLSYEFVVMVEMLVCTEGNF
jgi:hypothetical protein